MRVQRQNEIIRFFFSLPESRLVSRILGRMVTSYSSLPKDLDPRTAAVWYSTRGCVSARMSDIEMQEWVEHLHALKNDTIGCINDWRRRLSGKNTSPLDLSLSHASTFIVVLNDYRLMCAATHDINEKEMAIQSTAALGELPDTQRAALFEIHFLAWLVEETVRSLMPS